MESTNSYFFFGGSIDRSVSVRWWVNKLCNDIKVLLVSSTLIGATITLMSDQFARLILSPSEMPIGLATTILGAPVMMMLAFKIR